jgi:1-acyl-sn-glycerol-3-phosphate acyltransferase
MIPPRKHRLFARWFAWQGRRRLFRTFGAVRVRGADALIRMLEAHPVLVVSNHTAWWDPMVALLLGHHVVGFDGHALMDARNLRRLPFFGLVGAFGFDPSVPGDGAAALLCGARLLDRPGRVVWIFPQGREVPAEARPLAFARGAAVLARKAKAARVVPVGLTYAFDGAEKPSVFVSIGAPLTPRDAVSAEAQARAVTAELEAIAAARLAESEGRSAAAFARYGRRRRRTDPATRILAGLTARGAAPRDRGGAAARPR